MEIPAIKYRLFPAVRSTLVRRETIVKTGGVELLGGGTVFAVHLLNCLPIMSQTAPQASPAALRTTAVPDSAHAWSSVGFPIDGIVIDKCDSHGW
jgi:hypothetical protein